MGFHSRAPMSSAPDVHVEENGRRGEYGALPGSLSGGEGQWNENVRSLRISYVLLTYSTTGSFTTTATGGS